VTRVATDLQDSQLAVELKLENGTEGWQFFSVSYDPNVVSAERIKEILVGAGALIIPAPAGR
jgi:hypothetical protein